MIILMDVSGSISKEKRKIIKTMVKYKTAALKYLYNDKVELRYVTYATDAKERTEKEFYKVQSSGGTMYSVALGKAQEISSTYNSHETNIVIDMYSDDGNFTEDTLKAMGILKILSTDVVSFMHTDVLNEFENTNGQWAKELENTFGKFNTQLENEMLVSYTSLKKREEIPRALKDLMGK